VQNTAKHFLRKWLLEIFQEPTLAQITMALIVALGEIYRIPTNRTDTEFNKG
jgi:hypothetical protein